MREEHLRVAEDPSLVLDPNVGYIWATDNHCGPVRHSGMVLEGAPNAHRGPVSADRTDRTERSEPSGMSLSRTGGRGYRHFFGAPKPALEGSHPGTVSRGCADQLSGPAGGGLS